MLALYPIDCTTYMNKDSPNNPQLWVHGGHLQYLPMRDSRFPYLYSVPTHALVHSPQYIKKILIHIVNTSTMPYQMCQTSSYTFGTLRS